MKQIKSRFDKHLIPDLPKEEFEGRIIVVFDEGEAERAVNYLLSQPILGLDTETKPRFKSGKGMNKVALLQVSTPDTCFLFRLNLMGIPNCIVRLLEDKSVIKVGLSWHDDIMQLSRRRSFEPGTFVELQELVHVIGVKDLSLQKIYANLFGRKISKTQRLTNWEADKFTPAQRVYAATDAWACINIYNEIQRLASTGDYELEVVPEPEPSSPVRPTEYVYAPDSASGSTPSSKQNAEPKPNSGNKSKSGYRSKSSSRSRSGSKPKSPSEESRPEKSDTSPKRTERKPGRRKPRGPYRKPKRSEDINSSTQS